MQAGITVPVFILNTFSFLRLGIEVRHFKAIELDTAPLYLLPYQRLLRTVLHCVPQQC